MTTGCGMWCYIVIVGMGGVRWIGLDRCLGRGCGFCFSLKCEKRGGVGGEVGRRAKKEGKRKQSMGRDR